MILFLDYDGVVNTPIWSYSSELHKHICRYNSSRDGCVNNYQAVQWISELCQKYDLDIVVTSTWRVSKNYKRCLINGGLRENINILGCVCEDLSYDRALHIRNYLNSNPNIGSDFIIIDDDFIDMSAYGYDRDKHFIRCKRDCGFGYEEFEEACSKIESINNKIYPNKKGYSNSKLHKYLSEKFIETINGEDCE